MCASVESSTSWNRDARGPGACAVWRVGRGGEFGGCCCSCPAAVATVAVDCCSSCAADVDAIVGFCDCDCDCDCDFDCVCICEGWTWAVEAALVVL